jgi:thiopurine S-methyltransferase
MIKAKFWHERWETKNIPFHEMKPNPILVRHFDRLRLKKGARVFVPLCGKTLDIGWLLSKGFRVAGAELSPIAVAELFAELGSKPRIVKAKGAKIVKYSAKDIDIFNGDIFGMTRAMVGWVDAVYDRAALVALPEAVRKQYVAHLRRITNGAPQLLATFDYDQKAMDGPPFSISNAELVERYGKFYNLNLVASAQVPGGLKGKCPATENVWLLRRRWAESN